MYFAGMCSFGVFVTRAGDVFGRKLPSNISAIIAIPLLIGLCFSKSIILSAVLTFFVGATSPGRSQVVFVYICELVPNKYRSKIGSFILFMDCTTIAIYALYFRYISKQWLYLWSVNVGLITLATISLFFMPESPKYLHSKGRFEQAKLALSSIARFNGAKSFPSQSAFVFVEEQKKFDDANQGPDAIQQINTQQNEVTKENSNNLKMMGSYMGQHNQMSALQPSMISKPSMISRQHEKTKTSLISSVVIMHASYIEIKKEQ